MKRPLEDQVVVITGASHGIGWQTAHDFAGRGATVVVAARNEEALRGFVADVLARGGRAEAVVADVADATQVEAIGDRAIARFGRIDTWVNNAAVAIYATVEQLLPDEMERLVQVNLLGTMYGSRVAVRHMRSTGTGTIVNVGSALSDRAVPLQSAYVASKHGVAGFSEALRVELKDDASGIDVVLIQPSSINTPFFTWARSRIGVKPQPIPPVYQPSAVSEAILHAAEHGGREIVVGGAGKMLTVGQWLSPSLVDLYMAQGRRGVHQQETDRPDDRRDNLFEPSTGPGTATGEFGDGAVDHSVYTRLFELHPNRKRLAVGAALAGFLALVGRAAR